MKMITIKIKIAIKLGFSHNYTLDIKSQIVYNKILYTYFILLGLIPNLSAMIKKLLSLSLVSILLLSACAPEEKNPSLPALPPTVKTLDLSQKPQYQINEVGTIKATQEVELVAKMAGNIEQLTVKVGETVRNGQTIALIDSEEKNNSATVNYQNAQLQLSNARQTLDENQANNQDTVQRAQLRIQSLQTNIARLERNLQDQITQNKNSRTSIDLQIETAQKNADNAVTIYQNLVAKLEQSEKDLLNSTETSIEAIMVDLESNFTAAENILNPSRIQYFTVSLLNQGIGAANSILRSETVNKYQAYKNKYIKSKEDYKAALPISEENVQQIIDRVKTDLNELRLFLADVRLLLNSSVPDNNLTQAQIDGYLAAISAAEGMILGDLAKADGLAQSIAAFKLDRTSQIANAQNSQVIAQNQLSEAKNALVKFQTDSQAAIKDMETQIQQSKNDLDSAQADLDSAKRTAAIQNSGKNLEISTLTNQLKLAENALTNGKIVSTINGVVSTLEVEVGDYVAPGTPLGKIIQSEQVKVVFYVSKENINSMFIGQNFNFKTAEGSQEFKGYVSKISPTADPQNKKIMIEGVVENKGFVLKPEMLINLQMDLSEKIFDEKKVYVPMNSIIFNQNTEHVYVVKNNMAVKKDIEIGSVFGAWVEILSGLEKNDVLIVEGQRNLPPNGDVKITVTQ